MKFSVSVPDRLWHQAQSLAEHANSPLTVVQEALRRWVAQERQRPEYAASPPEQVEDRLRQAHERLTQEATADFQCGYADAVKCALQLRWRAIEDLADRYNFNVIVWAQGCAEVARAEKETPGADTMADSVQAEMSNVAAALAAAPGLLDPCDADRLKVAPGSAYLQGFAQAMRDLWSSVTGATTAPGETWDPRERDWRDGLADCQDFYATHGHLNVPAQASGNRINRLGAWISRKRAEYQAGILTGDQITALEACGMQWQGSRTRNRQQMIAALRAFHAERGHADVPVTYVTAAGLKLGQWLASKKQTVRSGGQLHPETKAALQQCGAAWADTDPGVSPPALATGTPP